jgi:hypothetical protein
MSSKADDNRLRRAAKRAGFSLIKNRESGLWYATRITIHRTLRIESPATGLDYDGMAQWLTEQATS